MPMTPMGTRTFFIRRPLGRVHSRMTSPTGSGSSATWRRPRAMSATRFSLSMRRSSISSLMPFARSRSMSALLAVRTSAQRASSASAMASRASFFSFVVSCAVAVLAAFAAAALSNRVFIRLPPFQCGRSCPDVLFPADGRGSGPPPRRCSARQSRVSPRLSS